MLKWLQEGLNQTSACRVELTLRTETDLFNFRCNIWLTYQLSIKGGSLNELSNKLVTSFTANVFENAGSSGHKYLTIRLPVN